MKLLFVSIAVLLSNLLHAQDLTGVWRGSFNSSDNIYSSLNIYDRYKFEVQIDDNSKPTFTGVTYSYKTTVFYGKAVANGTVNRKTGKVVLQELKIVELKMMSGSDACIMTCFLTYTKNGDEEFLEGKYSSYNEKDSTFCGKGTVLLRKVPESDFYKEPFLVKKEEEAKRRRIAAQRTPKKTTSPAAKPPVTTPQNKQQVTKTPPKTTPSVSGKQPSASSPDIAAKRSPEPETPPTKIGKVETQRPEGDAIRMPPPLATRTNEVVKTITVNTNEVTINVYDNGTIDRDTVSIYLDKKLIVSKQMLTTTPITVKLKFDDNSSYHELVMVAENLGEIPPNTSLMVVKAGDKEFEVRITSTEQKNAVIIFRYEKQ
jgi:hypothetical protein